MLRAATATDLNNAGARLFESGQYREADASLEQAIEIWSSAKEPPAELETALHNLAAAYRAQGRFAEAVPLYERALELREARAGDSDLSLIPPLTGLALLYLDKRELARSKQITSRAVAIAEIHASEQTAQTASAFVSLGSILAAHGNYSEGRLWLTRSLIARQRLFGPDSMQAADSLLELAYANQRERHLDEAVRGYRQALQIYETEHDVKYASTMRSLAEALILKHKRPEAQELLEEAEGILELKPGDNALELGRVKASLANLCVSEKRPKEAVVLYREALAILQPILGSENAQLLAILDSYARALRAGQDYATAAAIDMQAMRIRVHQALGKQG